MSERKQRILSAAVCAALIGVSGQAALAANIGWSTAQTNLTDNFFSGIFWTASNVPSTSKTLRANNGDSLFFAASNVTTLTNDRTSYTFGQVQFQSGSAAFTIGGNAFTLNTNITNVSTTPQIINNDITLATGVDHLFRATTGSNATGNIAIGGIVSGTNVLDTINKNGGNTVTFSNANTYVGATTVTQGVLAISNSSGLGATTAGTTVAANAALYLSGGITVGAEALTISGGGTTNLAANVNTGALRNVSGNNIYGGAITTTGLLTRFASDSGQLTLSNAAALNISSGAAVFSGAGTVKVSGAIAGTSTTLSNVSLDAGVDNSSVTVTLTGPNTYVGGTNINAGRLITGNVAALGAGPVTVGVVANPSATPPVLASVGTLTIGDGTTNNVAGLTGLTINNGSTLELAANTGVIPEIALASGTFTLGNINLDLNNLFNAAGDYVLISGLSGGTIGTVSFIDADTSSYSFAFTAGQPGDGTNGVLHVSLVPEPTSLALLGLGGLGLLRRRVRTA